jgi:hypothetical protein
MMEGRGGGSGLSERELEELIRRNPEKALQLIVKAFKPRELLKIGNRSYVDAFKYPESRFDVKDLLDGGQVDNPSICQVLRDPGKLFTDQVLIPPDQLVFQLVGKYYSKSGMPETAGMIAGGLTDAVAVIQNAIDTVYSNGGGEIFVKKAEYGLSKSLTAKPFVRMRSDGAVLKRLGNFIILNLTDANDFWIEGFTFDGNFINGSHMVYCGGFGDRIKIRNNKFINPPNNRFMLTFQINPSYYCEIVGNYFDGSGVTGADALAGVPGKSVIAYNYFKNPPYGGITAGAMEDVDIIGNIIDTPYTIGISIDTGTVPSYRVNIIGNIVLNSGSHGIRLGWSRDVPIYDSIIANNIVLNSGGAGIVCFYGRNIQIIGNRVEKPKGIGIGVRGFDNIVVVDNIVKDANDGGYTAYRDSSGIEIFAEVLTNYGNDRRNFLVEGNIVVDERATPQMKIGISMHLHTYYPWYLYDGRVIGNLVRGASVIPIAMVNEQYQVYGTDFGRYNIVVKDNYGFDVESFKSAGLSISIGVNGAYGSAKEIFSRSGVITYPRVKITWGGTFGTGETVTVKVEAVYSDNTTAYVEKSATSTGSLWLTDDDILSLITQGKDIVKLNVYAKSSAASTSVTVTVDAYGKA